MRTEQTNILVVEDDPTIAAALVEILVDAGHGVVGAFTTDDFGIDAATHSDVRLAFVSPTRQGKALARRLDEHWGVSTIFQSAIPVAPADLDGLGVAYLTEPFSSKEILSAVEVALDAIALKEKVRRTKGLQLLPIDRQGAVASA